MPGETQGPTGPVGLIYGREAPAFRGAGKEKHYLQACPEESETNLDGWPAGGGRMDQGGSCPGIFTEQGCLGPCQAAT